MAGPRRRRAGHSTSTGLPGAHRYIEVQGCRGAGAQRCWCNGAEVEVQRCRGGGAGASDGAHMDSWWANIIFVGTLLTPNWGPDLQKRPVFSFVLQHIPILYG
jgi:hypothetical protein